MNLEHDIREAGVQMILLVEDSVRFYSSILPNLYNYILEQSKNFSKEALNRHAATMRMRGRPKVVLARTYEEAQKLYDKYSNNTLGVISDARFPLKSAAKAFGNEVEQEANPEHGTDTFGREKCPRCRIASLPLHPQDRSVRTAHHREFRERQPCQGRSRGIPLCR